MLFLRYAITPCRQLVTPLFRFERHAAAMLTPALMLAMPLPSHSYADALALY